MTKIYTIISGKGGVGKTTSTINLGTALNLLGKDVTIVDCNLTTPNLGIHLGAPIVPITINHVLKNNAKIEDAIYEHESGTKVIPASISLKETFDIDYNKIPDMIQKLKILTDFILIDAAAGLGHEARSSVLASDELIVITNPEISAVTDALKTIKLAEEYNKPVKGVIITRYEGKKTEMSIQNILDMLEIPLLGIIHEDISIKESQVIRNSVIHTHPNSIATRNYIDTSKRILGEDIPFQNLNKLGIIGRFLKSIGLK